MLWNLDEEELVPEFEPFPTDKQCSWSPKGTYLIVIKSDKVEFIGGKDMKPILTINEPKVESVIFSPDETHIMVYCPKNDFPYAVWNFQTHEKKREFEQATGEDGLTFKWSFNGAFIAKVTTKTVVKEIESSPTKKKEKDDGEEKEAAETIEIEKTYITVYELPSMKMLEDSDGNRTSVFVDGLKEFMWAPHKNVIVYTAFPTGENVFPRVNFMEMPTRRVLKTETFKDCQDLRIYFHPQGNFLACMNQFMHKKTTKYSAELFETKDMHYGQIPHQQVLVDREVQEFHGIIWEPHQGKLAIHTLSRKVTEAGMKQFSNNPIRNGVDIYQLKSDPILGFVCKRVGFLPSEKTVEFYFSGAGNIFVTVELEGTSSISGKHSINFFYINKISNEGETMSTTQHVTKKGQALIKDKQLAAVDDTYEFRKTARHEITDRKWYAKWDNFGRYFVVYGRKTSMLDKQPKSIKFYNMFGELLNFHTNLLSLDQIAFRPRPSDTLKPDQIKKLKKEYKKKYEKMFRDEENQDKKVQNEIVKDQKK